MRGQDERILSEDALIARIREIFSAARGRRLLNEIGDDVALWQPSRSHRSVITTDASIEGVHFRRDMMSLHDAGYRAMAANISDIAAAGGRAVLATLTLGLPQETPADDALAICRGVAACAQAFDVQIAGGDLTRAQAIAISITVVGEVRPTHFKGRGGARPGDILAVTGALGAAAAGLRIADRRDVALDAQRSKALDAFRRPQARLAQGRWLAASRNVHAMMDLSDGIAADVPRLCERSACGAAIDNVPVSPAAENIAQLDGIDAATLALCGGEDYELLAAVAPRAFDYLAARFRARFGTELIRIGQIRRGSGVVLVRGGVEQPLPAGFDHFSQNGAPA